MRIIATIPSRNENDPHSIRIDDLGNLFCTCEAAVNGLECWALGKIKAEREFSNMLAKGLKMPSKDDLIKQAQDSTYRRMQSIRDGAI